MESLLEYTLDEFTIGNEDLKTTWNKFVEWLKRIKKWIVDFITKIRQKITEFNLSRLEQKFNKLVQNDDFINYVISELDKQNIHYNANTRSNLSLVNNQIELVTRLVMNSINTVLNFISVIGDNEEVDDIITENKKMLKADTENINQLIQHLHKTTDPAIIKNILSIKDYFYKNFTNYLQKTTNNINAIHNKISDIRSDIDIETFVRISSIIVSIENITRLVTKEILIYSNTLSIIKRCINTYLKTNNEFVDSHFTTGDNSSMEKLYIGNEGWASIKKTIQLKWNQLKGNNHKCVELYNWFIQQKFTQAQLENILRNTEHIGFRKEKLEKMITSRTKALQYIYTEVKKMKDSNAYRTRNTNEESYIFKNVMKILKDGDGFTGIEFDEHDDLIETSYAGYKDEYRKNSIYNLGYKTLADINNLVSISRYNLSKIEEVLETLWYYEKTWVSTLNTTTVKKVDKDGNPIEEYSYTTTDSQSVYIKIVSMLYELATCVVTLLAWDFKEVVKILKTIYSSKAGNEEFSFSDNVYSHMFNKLDAGLEFFGFGKPKDGDVKNDPIFGDIKYNAKNNDWHSATFFNLVSKYTTYNGANWWCGTYITDPITSDLRKLGTNFRYVFSQRTYFDSLLTYIANSINSAEEESGVFNASCDKEKIITGNDPRFCMVMLQFTYSKAMKRNVCIITSIFNKRVFYTYYFDNGSAYCYVPEAPTIISGVRDNSKLGDINKLANITINDSLHSFGKSANEGYISKNTEYHRNFNNLLQEALSDYVEGEFDDEDTDVSINSPNPDDTNADVDIRIDMTPEREQVLLKAYTVNFKEEIDTYGIAGIKHKLNKNVDELTSLFKSIYELNAKANTALNTFKDSDIVFALEHISTDIITKEKFVEDIKEHTKNVEVSFKNLISLVESSNINYMNNIDPISITKNTTTPAHCYNANFNEHTDIVFINREMNKTKVNVNMSQIKLYTNKLIDKLEKNTYNDKTYKHINLVINNLNNSLITLANTLSQGMRFMSDVAEYCN